MLLNRIRFIAQHLAFAFLMYGGRLGIFWAIRCPALLARTWRAALGIAT